MTLGSAGGLGAASFLAGVFLAGVFLAGSAGGAGGAGTETGTGAIDLTSTYLEAGRFTPALAVAASFAAASSTSFFAL